jgi:signal transduction histidine kinase
MGGSIMKKACTVILIVFLVVSFAYAQGQFGTAEEAKTLMNKAVTYLKDNGKDKAFEAFNNKKGDFVNKDLYIFVLDLNGKILSHGANEKLIGRDMMATKDKSGQLFIKKMVDLANAEGKGEVEYYWDNPVTKQVAPKVSILEKVGDVIVACGYYK